MKNEEDGKWISRQFVGLENLHPLKFISSSLCQVQLRGFYIEILSTQVFGFSCGLPNDIQLIIEIKEY